MTKYGVNRRDSLSISNSLPAIYTSNVFIQDMDTIIQSVYLDDDDGQHTITLPLDYQMIMGSKSVINNPKNLIIGYFQYHDIYVESITLAYDEDNDPILEINIDLNHPFVLDFSLF